jgi:hypothetical protein
MANKLRGEVNLVIDGQTRTLRLTNNALCEVEALFGDRSIYEIIDDKRQTVRRALVWAALRGGEGEQASKGLTLEAVGELMDAADPFELRMAIEECSLIFLGTPEERRKNYLAAMRRDHQMQNELMSALAASTGKDGTSEASSSSE